MQYLWKKAALAAVLAGAVGLAGCLDGDDGLPGLQGPPGNDGAGFVPAPPADQPLGNYDTGADRGDPTDDPANQDLDSQLADSSGVWQITLDHKVQVDLGDGTPPVIADTILYNSNTNEIWLTINGESVALTPFSSIGCGVGVAKPCFNNFEVFPADTDYVALNVMRGFHGPAMDTSVFAVSGVKTAAADMPTTGTASYSGRSFNRFGYTRPDGSEFNFFNDGAVTVDVDFATGAVIWTDIEPVTTRTTFTHDLAGNAIIDGNSYTGGMSGTAVGNVADAANTLDIVGTLEGTFYGPPADDGNFSSEIGGVWFGNDADPDPDAGGNPTSAVGSGGGHYTASQNPPL